jgi:hypothetical protein
MALKFLPPKLVPKGSKPPPESKAEILGSRLLHKVRGKAGLYFDGCGGWKAAAEQVCRSATVYQVSHRCLEFTKKVSPTSKRHSSTAGTQIIDRRWESLDAYVPSELHVKAHSHGPMNLDALESYVWSWVWRKNLQPEQDLLVELGRCCG